MASQQPAKETDQTEKASFQGEDDRSTSNCLRKLRVTFTTGLNRQEEQDF
jgi:hypothetical protein